jgi:hypothetical protein
MFSRPDRILRWTFSRRHETIRCELAVGAGGWLHELRTSGGPLRRGVVCERFGDVGQAFGRQCQIEADLIADGWTLDGFERAWPRLLV